MDEVRRRILAVLDDASGEKCGVEDLKDSPLADFGSPIAFKIAKRGGKSPHAIAQEIASKIKPEGIIERVSAEAGYVNFTLNAGEALKLLLSSKAAGRKPVERIILEHTSVNPTGPVHVGRIRNTIIGDCLRRILVHAGYDVETHYFVNDVGKQVAIIASGLRKSLQPDPELVAKYSKYSERDDYGIFFTYVAANRLFEEDMTFQAEVQSLIKAAESGDTKILAEITSAAKKCLSGQLQTFTRLGAVFDVFDFESAGLIDGSVEEVIQKIRADRNYVKNEVGEGLDLSGFGLGKRGGMSVLVRSDGTSVYTTRDVAYHLKKLAEGDRIINVLGEDHKLQSQELQTILAEVFGVKKPMEAVHFSFVSFEGVKFSTRKGEIAAVDELLDEAHAKALAEVEKRELGDEATAKAVGVGAVKFHIVRTTPNKQITFRWGDALNFEGDSGPYVQYAHARSCRIIEKSGVDPKKIKSMDYSVKDDEERKLILKLLAFEESVEDAARHRRPDLVAAYLLDLTGTYGRFYMKCPVLDSPEPVRNRRLVLVGKLRDTIKTGLGLLGIEAPERM